MGAEISLSRIFVGSREKHVSVREKLHPCKSTTTKKEPFHTVNSKALFLFLHFAVALPRKGGSERRVGSATWLVSWSEPFAGSHAELLARGPECLDALPLRSGADGRRAFPEEWL